MNHNFLPGALKKVIAMCFILLCPPCARAEGAPTPRTNPFLTAEEENTLSTPTLDHLTLSAILYSPSDSNSKAIINGQILKKGDNIDDKEIIRIDAEKVILQDDRGQYSLPLKTSFEE